MEEKIMNVYKFELDENLQSYIYSVKKDNDFLGFDYYVLSKNKKNEINIYEATNTIKLLHSNNINLIPISKFEDEYNIFITDLSKAMNNKKEETLIRK